MEWMVKSPRKIIPHKTVSWSTSTSWPSFLFPDPKSLRSASYPSFSAILARFRIHNIAIHNISGEQKWRKKISPDSAGFVKGWWRYASQTRVPERRRKEETEAKRADLVGEIKKFHPVRAHGKKWGKIPQNTRDLKLFSLAWWMVAIFLITSVFFSG